MRVVTTLSPYPLPPPSQPGYLTPTPPTSAMGDQPVDPQIRKKKGEGGGREGLAWVSREPAVGGKNSRTVEGSYPLSLSLLS